VVAEGSGVRGWRDTQNRSRNRWVGRKRRKEEKRVVKKRSKIIRRKTFRTQTSTSCAFSPDVQTLKNLLCPCSKMRAKIYQYTSDYFALLPAFCSLVLS